MGVWVALLDYIVVAKSVLNANLNSERIQEVATGSDPYAASLSSYSAVIPASHSAFMFPFLYLTRFPDFSFQNPCFPRLNQDARKINI